MRRLAAALVTAVALLAACSTGDDADSGDPASPFVDELSAVFTSGGSGPKLDDQTADCIAVAIVDLAGVPALTAAGITPTELAESGDLQELGLQLPTDAATTLAGDFAACDLGAAVIEPFVRALAEDSDGELSDEAVVCVVEATSQEDVEAGLSATFVEADDGTAAFEAVILGLGTCPDTVTQLLANGFETANGEVDLSVEARECLAAEVAADPVGAAATFSTESTTESDVFATALIESCPGIRS